ncbi:DUF3011 domain-containing protein [Pseudoxanthomonas sp. JBR18]|uniref:DUF3011 domain-containing protein n=1 Tax=Pseudoxanthomonas sp. JBR18 TaxID=2969308 RepID=UPI002305D8EE|nr:DUF3011 domain-containing protein [Pseudoxanthomonas sp. JBR18]WCE04016.1 DUF3011 domain-containing protein [Pseudoxanthomonas sp. JBR18]
MRQLGWGALGGLLMVLSGCATVGNLLGGHERTLDDVPVVHFKCESKSQDLKYCDVDASAGVRLTKQLSNMPCIKGRTWDYGRFGVWVDHGCRGEFISGAGDDDGGMFDTRHKVVRCESEDQARRRCPIEVSSPPATLLRQISDTKCVEGSTWGWDAQGVWVDGGCRGLFRVR